MESTNDHQVPPQPPPRFTSQQSKTIPLTPVIDNKDFDSNVKPIRPEIWFRIAYISVSSAIFGILTILCGTILFLIRIFRLKTKNDEVYYFGRYLNKNLSIYIFFIGLGIALLSGLLYHASLLRIGRYIESIQNYNSKAKREARERNIYNEDDSLLKSTEYN
ncbi:hypothetical protein RDWZM_009478 [Blomia tropicalis]|uniref:Uncharacterized protein n=1 Tax=Blomia tropicalis TaxID=40697 RepID=A0A9Q0RMC0_BLOTA|nr:hypothetical protein BLOT_011799 [Blomia tropicalis]KAJ6218321.1 hypothetical protein RDWZM_009478 [Blomia tropicalis]